MVISFKNIHKVPKETARILYFIKFNYERDLELNSKGNRVRVKLFPLGFKNIPTGKCLLGNFGVLLYQNYYKTWKQI